MGFDYKNIRKVTVKKASFQLKASVNKQKIRCKLVVHYLKLDIKKAILPAGGNTALK